jgi:hypothetical protein
MRFHRVLAWGSGLLITVWVSAGSSEKMLRMPSVLAQTYQATLNQKMANLKKTEDR